MNQLTENFDDLTAWAKEHGPDHLKYAAERGFTVKSGAMDVIAERVAIYLGGRVYSSGELLRWTERVGSGAWDADLASIMDKVHAFEATLPKRVDVVMPSTAVRIEEQTDLSDPKRILKYTGVVIRVSHPATLDRYVIVNLEAQP